MEAKWWVIGIIGALLAIYAPIAVVGYAEQAAKGQIGVACIEAGKNWGNGACTE